MDFIKTVANLRHDYGKDKFDENTADDSPFEQFRIWFESAVNANFKDPNAFILSTVGSDMMPSSRVVLLKNYNNSGFVFYTNYNSDKGIDLNNNPKASMLFFWDTLERQIRIKGTVAKVSQEESEEYFSSRPYTSRIGAWASKQSKVLTSRFSLLRDVAFFMAKFPSHVPLPPFWGGYRISPLSFEFWQGRESRLHDRIFYSIENGVWIKKRLSP